MTEVVKKTRRRRAGNRQFDAHVGQRVRLRRTLLGMSQEKLGEALGLTFQQVQKYERGANRISAGTLYRLAQILDVPISFFFDGIEDASLGATPLPTEAADAVLSRREARILRLSRQAPPEVVEQIVGLLGAVCREPGEDEVTPAPTTDTPKPQPARIREPREPREPRDRDLSAANRRRRRYGAVWDPADISLSLRTNR